MDHIIIVEGLKINENIILLIFCTNQIIFRGAARNSRQVATCYTEVKSEAILRSEIYRKESSSRVDLQ